MCIVDHPIIAVLWWNHGGYKITNGANELYTSWCYGAPYDGLSYWSSIIIDVLFRCHFNPRFLCLSWVFSPSHFFTSGTDASSSETISIVPSLDKTIAAHRYHEGRESRTRCEIFTAFEFDIFHLPPSNFYKITKEVYI